MLRLLLAIIATVSAGLLLTLADSMRRPLARLVRAMLLGLVALLTMLGLAIGVTGLVQETWWAAIVGGGILAVALRLGWALRRRHRRLSRPPQQQQQQQEPSLEPGLHVPLTRALPDPHWRSFERELDWVGRQQARRSRAAIAGFVAERESASLTPDHRSLLLSCERRVPELIDTCIERCRNASGRERDRYIDETLARLEQIGVEAERARREVREADDRRLHILHRYFDGVAGDSDEQRKLR